MKASKADLVKGLPDMDELEAQRAPADYVTDVEDGAAADVTTGKGSAMKPRRARLLGKQPAPSVLVGHAGGDMTAKKAASQASCSGSSAASTSSSSSSGDGSGSS